MVGQRTEYCSGLCPCTFIILVVVGTTEDPQIISKGNSTVVSDKHVHRTNLHFDYLLSVNTASHMETVSNTCNDLWYLGL